MSAKEDIINEIEISLLADGISPEVANTVVNKIALMLKGCVISKECTDLALNDSDEDAIMLRKFIISKKLKGCTERTIAFYTAELGRIIPKLKKPLKEITVDDIRWFIAEKEFSEGCGRVSCKNSLRVLSSLFEFLVVEEYVTSNPVKKFGQYKVEKRRKSAFTEYEIETMRELMTDPKTKAIFELLLSTGCRVSELCQIKKEEINGDEILVHGKGNKDRIVHLNARAQKALETYIESKCDESKKSIWLFPMKEHKHTVSKPEEHIDKGTVETCIRKLGQKAGVRAYPHKFRRTCATFALRRGMDLMYVSKMLGHESVDTTQIYLDLDEETLKTQHKRFVV